MTSSRVLGLKAAANSSKSSSHCGGAGRVGRRPQRHIDRCAAGHDDRGRIAVVERLDQDDLVAGIDQGLDGGKDALGGADGDDDLLERIQVTAKERAVDVGNGIDQPGMAGGPRVLVQIPFNGFLGGGFDKIRSREIGEALPQVDGADVRWPAP